MPNSAEIMRLVDRIVTDEEDFEEERELLALTRSDVASALETGRNPQTVLSSGKAVARQSEMGPEIAAVVAACKFITLAWGTYNAAKLASAEVAKLGGALGTVHPAAEAIWSERLKDAGLPEELAKRIAKKYASEFSKLDAG